MENDRPEKKMREEKDDPTCEELTQKGEKCLNMAKQPVLEAKMCYNTEDIISSESIDKIQDLVFIELNDQKFCHSRSDLLTFVQRGTDQQAALNRDGSVRRYSDGTIIGLVRLYLPVVLVELRSVMSFLGNNSVNYASLVKTQSTYYVLNIVYKFDEICSNYCNLHFKKWLGEIIKKNFLLNLKYSILYFHKENNENYFKLDIKYNEKNLDVKKQSVISNHSWVNFLRTNTGKYYVDDIIRMVYFFNKFRMIDSIVYENKILLFDPSTSKDDVCFSTHTLRNGICVKNEIRDLLGLVQDIIYDTRTKKITLLVGLKYDNIEIKVDFEKKTTKIYYNNFDMEDGFTKFLGNLQKQFTNLEFINSSSSKLITIFYSSTDYLLIEILIFLKQHKIESFSIKNLVIIDPTKINKE